MERKDYIDYTDSNGKTHKILKGIYPKQCDGYYEAKKRGDASAMHWLHIPYWERPYYSIQSELKMIEHHCEFDREMSKPLWFAELEGRLFRSGSISKL